MTPNEVREALFALIIIAISIIAAFPCWVIILIKMFRNDKPLTAVFGLLFWPWAFIWGWMKLGTLNLSKVMIPWTLCILVGVIGMVMFAPKARPLYHVMNGTAPPAQH